jgi:hypothetical protein
LQCTKKVVIYLSGSARVSTSAIHDVQPRDQRHVRQRATGGEAKSKKVLREWDSPRATSKTKEKCHGGRHHLHPSENEEQARIVERIRDAEIRDAEI